MFFGPLFTRNAEHSFDWPKYSIPKLISVEGPPPSSKTIESCWKTDVAITSIAPIFEDSSPMNWNTSIFSWRLFVSFGLKFDLVYC